LTSATVAEDQQRAGDPRPAAAPRDVEHRPLHAEDHQNAGRGGLACELRERVELVPVVEGADTGQQHRGAEDTEHLVRVVVERQPQRGQLVSHADPGQHAAEHRQPAPPGGRRHVHVAPAGPGHRAQAQRQHPHRADEQERDHCRRQSREQVLPDG
jgi:hypothetical protein